MRKITAITLLFLILYSCKKDKDYIIKHTYEKFPFEEVWSIKNSSDMTCSNTLVTKNSVVFAYKQEGLPYTLISFDKKTGDTLWQKNITNRLHYGEYRYEYDLILIDNYSYLTAINPVDRTTKWVFNQSGVLCDYYCNNGKIYAFFRVGGNPTDSTILYEIDPINGTGNEILSLNFPDFGGYTQHPNGIAFWKHPNGNDILVIQSKSFYGGKNRGDYYAYDITNDSIYWHLGWYFNDTNTINDGEGAYPQIAGNNVIIHSVHKGIASFNLINKTLNWETPIFKRRFSDGFEKMNVSQNINRVHVASTTWLGFKTYDLNSGNLIHAEISDSYVNSGINIYNNNVYSSSGGLRVMDGETGKTKEFLESLKFDKTYGGTDFGFDVDPENGYVYTTRGDFFVCFKISLK